MSPNGLRVILTLTLQCLYGMMARVSSETVTLLVTDIVGSVYLGGERTMQGTHVLRDTAVAQGGRLVNVLGDGLMLSFDSALDGLAGAIAMQQALDDYSQQHDEGNQIQARMGLHIGEPISDGEDYFGTPVVIVTRLCDVAEAGQILASSLVRDVVGSRGGYTFRELKPLHLRGFAEPVSAVEVVWQATGEKKEPTRQYDVFLCYNSEDRAAVRRIAERLRQHGFLPWFDESELIPGRPWQEALEEAIVNIRSAAVFLGPNGPGPWQDREIRALLRWFVRDGKPLIPVVLQGVQGEPEMPDFLKDFTWVDFRAVEPEPFERLAWGITGQRGSR